MRWLASPWILVKRGVGQSAPTALPSYFQGAVQALARQVDRLAAFVEQEDVQAVSSKPANLVTDLFSKLLEEHPGFKGSGKPIQESLRKMLDLLPSLIQHTEVLNLKFYGGSVKVEV